MSEPKTAKKRKADDADKKADAKQTGAENPDADSEPEFSVRGWKLRYGRLNSLVVALASELDEGRAIKLTFQHGFCMTCFDLSDNCGCGKKKSTLDQEGSTMNGCRAFCQAQHQTATGYASDCDGDDIERKEWNNHTKLFRDAWAFMMYKLDRTEMNSTDGEIHREEWVKKNHSKLCCDKRHIDPTRGLWGPMD